MVTRTKELNIIICGVGGQGVILMSELLGYAVVHDRLKVRGSEVLGMAQRGGSVVSNIRIGNEIYAPLIPEGRCNLMAAMEPSEALRNINFLAKSSLIVLNTKKIIPYTIYNGESKYPSLEVILEKLSKVVKKVVIIDADQLALKAGSRQTANLVMLGALLGTGLVPIEIETIKTIIQEHFPDKISTTNIKAFNLGYKKSQKSFAAT